MKPAFLTFIYGDETYVKFGSKLLSKFKENGYETFVYTEKKDQFNGHNVILYEESTFSYHHKIFAVEKLYDLGYKEILLIDADLIINDDVFFNLLSAIKFEDGISYTRNGLSKNLEEFIGDVNLNSYKQLIKKYNLENLNLIKSVWEDIIYFNLNNIDCKKFFDYYHELTDIKHEFDRDIRKSDRFGDQEGYTIVIASKLSKTPIQINKDFRKTSTNIIASNYTYDNDIIKPILSELDIIIPYRKDSEERKLNLLKVIDYYKKHFKDTNFIISEQGTESTIEIDGFDYTFRKKDLPHNQSQCINDGVKLSKKKYVCVIDCDIILLDYYNIYTSLKQMFMDEIDYCLPYTECFDLPDFKIREPWGKKCVGGIFIINREKFIGAGMNDEGFVGWGREDDERHHRLINKGFRFKRMTGYIMHLFHPDQRDIGKTSEINLDRLKEITNDNSYIN